jgi:hypothetical protein
VRRIDQSGGTTWTKTFPLNTSNKAVATSPDGRIAIAGELNSDSIGFDTWVMVLDEEGNELWSKSFDHGGSESVGDVIFDPENGDVIVVGSYVADSVDTFIQRLDGQGNERWFEGYDVSSGLSDGAGAVGVAADGTLWVAGNWWPDEEQSDYWIGQFAP